jgi:hypothetical protein
MTESQRHRQEFVTALMNELAELWREGTTRVERSQVEEIRRQCGLDQTEAYQAFAAVRGDVWEGEYIESEEEPGWKAVGLENVPAVDRPAGETSI